MPIASFLDGERFDPETKRIMGLAYEMARAVLARQWGDNADMILAQRIIALAKDGERDPEKLCDGALKTLGK
jgi:hypothetical protein